MATQIEVPESLVHEIGCLVGPNGLETFLLETAQAEVRRRRLLQTLDELRKDGPIWRDEDHPELVELGTEGWIRALRRGERLHKTDAVGPADE